MRIVWTGNKRTELKHVGERELFVLDDDMMGPGDEEPCIYMKLATKSGSRPPGQPNVVNLSTGEAVGMDAQELVRLLEGELSVRQL